jgi:hypothetical protein
MAGVMATSRSSCAAMSHSHWPNTWVKVGLGGVAGLTRPTAGSNLPGPWYHRVGLGQLVALALLGDHVQELRARLSRRFSSVGISESRSWPSIGPT